VDDFRIITMPRKFPVIWLLVPILLLAYGLRVWLLADTNINWDEGYSVWMSRHPLDVMMDTTARDVHPPLYYLMLRGGRFLWGEGEFAWRYVSLLTGVFAVALVYRFGQVVGGRYVGVIAAVLLAVSRANVHISQLTRMHILAAVLCTGAMWAAVRIWDNPRRWRAMLVYVLCTAGALYTFYLTIMLPLAVNTAALVVLWWKFRRDGTRPALTFAGMWAGLQVIAALLFVPWMLYAVERMFGWRSDDITRPLFFMQFYSSTLTVGRPTFDLSQLPFVGVYLAAIAAGMWALLHTRRAEVNRMVLLLAGILTPAAVVFVLALPFHSYGRPLAARYLIMLSACFYVLAAWGVVALWHWRKWAGAVSLAVMLVVAGWGMSNIAYNAVRRDDMHSIAAMLNDMRGDDDRVLLHNDKTWTTLAALYDGSFDVVRQGENVTEGYARFVWEFALEDHDAVWLITTPSARVNDPDNIIKAYIEDRSRTQQEWTFNDHTLTFFALSAERVETAHDLLYMPDVPLNGEEAAGLAGYHMPIQRYPVGNSVNLALYWDTVPDEAVTMTLTPQNVDAPITHIIEPSIRAETGITRQQVTVPLLPEYPTGRYSLSLTVGEVAVPLPGFTVVSFQDRTVVEEGDIPNRTDAVFGEHITLLGYELNPRRIRQGRDLTVTLYWRTDALLTERYKVSVFLLGDAFNPDSGNPLWGQVDAEPLNWELPTTQWIPDEILADPYTFTVPQTTPPGNYQLNVVMYDAVTGERLPVNDGDMLTLQGVTLP
jgi:4-amino-4-deoxy-L-arabinose transferase-like glycosyltransferase